MNRELISSIIIQLIFQALFLIVFFFIYLSFVERHIVEQQVLYIVDNINDILTNIYGDNVTDIKNEYIAPKLTMTPNQTLYYTDLDNNSNDANMSILKTALIYISIFIIIMCILLYFLKDDSFSFLKILKHNIVFLCMVAVIEFIFVNMVVINFMSVDRNLTMKTIINSALNYTNS